MNEQQKANPNLPAKTDRGRLGLLACVLRVRHRLEVVIRFKQFPAEPIDNRAVGEGANLERRRSV
jgi:hypothetical protein